MCFSLQASTIAAGTLTTLGTLCFAQQYKNKTRFVALIPLLFGIQQAAEAFVWGHHLSQLPKEALVYANYTFLFFAYIVWPVWVPLALWYAEPRKHTRTLLYVPIATGIITACILAYILINGTVNSTVQCAHIIYHTNIPTPWYVPLSMLYVGSTVLPWFLSSIPRLWIIGGTMLIAYGVSLWLYTNAFTSVWCFFAAAISSLTALALSNYQKQHN